MQRMTHVQVLSILGVHAVIEKVMGAHPLCHKHTSPLRDIKVRYKKDADGQRTRSYESSFLIDRECGWEWLCLSSSASNVLQQDLLP